MRQAPIGWCNYTVGLQHIHTTMKKTFYISKWRCTRLYKDCVSKHYSDSDSDHNPQHRFQTLEMHRSIISLLSFAAIASAHFQLQFPPPRGPFTAANEPTFCGVFRCWWNNYPAHCRPLDGYNNPAANRTQFPLTGGFYSLNSEHPQWTC